MTDTYSLVLSVLRDLEIDVDGVDGGSRLREDLEVDSTELVEIAVAVERAAGVAVETNDVLAMKTVGDLVSYLAGASPRDE